MNYVYVCMHVFSGTHAIEPSMLDKSALTKVGLMDWPNKQWTLTQKAEGQKLMLTPPFSIAMLLCCLQITKHFKCIKPKQSFFMPRTPSATVVYVANTYNHSPDIHISYMSKTKNMNMCERLRKMTLKNGYSIYKPSHEILLWRRLKKH